jgi:hypothetical protein
VRSLNTFIQAEPALKPLMRRLSELSAIQQLYGQIVPPSLVKLGQVGSFHDGTLIIVAENGAAAAKLKQVMPEITEQLSQRLNQALDVRVSVQVESFVGETEPTRRKKSPLSPAAIQSLSQLADDLPPSPLKEEVALLVTRQTRAKRK